MSTALLMFLVFFAVTFVITYWAARRSSGAAAYFAANRQITGWQNGLAVAGKYTMADVLAYRLSPRPVRSMASLSTLTVSTFYMIAQMIGAGALVSLLLPGVGFNVAVVCVGVLMIVYVVFGGMLATTWVQIPKAILLMSGTLLLSILVLAHFGFSFGQFFEAISNVTYTDPKTGATVAKN